MAFMGEKIYAAEYFLIERPRLGLRFSYEFEEDERRGNINREDSSSTFSEGFDVETNGWVYDPAFVVYKLRLSPEWEQRLQQNEGLEKRTTKTNLQGYHTELIFLQYKPYTLNIFANRKTSTLLSEFAQRSKTESDTYGALVSLKYSILPTTLSYQRQESIQTGFFTTDAEMDDFRLSVRHYKHLGDTRLEASYTDSTQTTFGRSINTTLENITLQNTYNLTADKKASLNSGLRYMDAKSDFIKTTGFGISEGLQWRHKENLTTDYNLRYDKTDTDTFNIKSTTGVFNLRHRLYENLTTLLNIQGFSSQFTGGQEAAYGGGIDLNYQRKIPWKGMLNIMMGHNYKITERDITANLIQVTDESVTLTDGVITLLGNEDVDVDSIVVTDATGVIVYEKDIDYEITEIDSFVRITRITTGRISNGQKVLVDYRYFISHVFDYSFYSQSYGINIMLWSSWRTYYRFVRLKQRFLSGIPPDKLTDDNIHTAGTELQWKWSTTRLEFEDKQTVNVPTKSWRAEENIILRPSDRLFLNLSGNYGAIEFKDTGDIERFNGIRANIQRLVSVWGKFTLEGFSNKISGNLEKNTETGVLSIFEWVYGIWSGNLSYRFLNEKNYISQDSLKKHYVLFEIKRALF